MGIEVISEFIRLATVRTRAYIYNDDDTLVDPTSASIEIVNPSGATVVSGTTGMSSAATGIYEHYYNTPSTAVLGWYRGKITIVDGTGDTAKATIGVVSFKVKEV